MRRFEPLDDAFEPERPTLLFAALNMLVENGVQTKAQIVDALKLNYLDIEQLCGASTGFLDQKVVRLELRQKETDHSECSLCGPSGPYLAAYVSETAWRENNRRVSDGEQYLMTTSAALTHPVSRQWKNSGNTRLMK